MRITVTVRGDASFRSALARGPQSLRERLIAVVAQSAERMDGELERTCPVKSGFMRDHRRTTPAESGLRYEIGWYDADFSPAKKALYPVFLEFGTSRMPAQPTLLPAFDVEVPRFTAAVQAAMQAWVQAAAA